METAKEKVGKTPASSPIKTPIETTKTAVDDVEQFMLTIDGIHNTFAVLSSTHRTEKAKCIVAIWDIIQTAKKKDIVLSQASVAQRIGWEKSTLNKAFKTVNDSEKKQSYIDGIITLQGNPIKNTKTLYLIKDAVKFLLKSEMIPTVENVKNLVSNASEDEIKAYFKTITKKTLKELTVDLAKLLTRIIDYKEISVDGKEHIVKQSVISKAIADTIKDKLLTGQYPEVYDRLKAHLTEKETPKPTSEVSPKKK